MKTPVQQGSGEINRTSKWVQLIPITAMFGAMLCQQYFHLSYWVGTWFTVLFCCPFFGREIFLSWRHAEQQKQALEHKFADQDAQLLAEYQGVGE